MNYTEYFNNILNQGLLNTKLFEKNEFVRHVLIENIDLSVFDVPKFDMLENSFGNLTDFRAQYIEYIQPHLKGIINPCIYIFEIVNTDINIVYNSYLDFYNKQKKMKGSEKRICSAINHKKIAEMRNDKAPQILYVGKSEKPIDGRIVVHFGYYEKGVTGMQLVFWGKEIGLKVNVHVFEFISNQMCPYLEVLEKLFFVQLKPIIGIK